MKANRKKRLLVTGANGFVGSFLCEEALARNYEVVAAVRKNSDLSWLTSLKVNIEVIPYDNVQQLEEYFSISEPFDYVIHNAGLTKANKRETYYEVNTGLTKKLVNAIIMSNNLPKKFVLVSSLAAYGPAEGTRMVSATDEPNPISTYGKSKLEAEAYLRITEDVLPHLIFRPTAVYGPREKDIFIMLKMLKSHLELYCGTQKQQLTFIYVKDLVRVIMDSLESPYVNRSYFVSDGKVYDQYELAGIAKKMLKIKTLKLNLPDPLVKGIAQVLERVYALNNKVPTINTEKVKELMSTNWTCDTSALVKDFGFTPQYDLDRGWSEAINWYRNNNWI